MIHATEGEKDGPRIPAGDAVPHEVVELHVSKEMSYPRAWREYLHMTQAEVAEKAGITQAALSQIEAGGKRVRRATLEKLAGAMGLNVSQLA